MTIGFHHEDNFDRGLEKSRLQDKIKQLEEENTTLRRSLIIQKKFPIQPVGKLVEGIVRYNGCFDCDGNFDIGGITNFLEDYIGKQVKIYIQTIQNDTNI